MESTSSFTPKYVFQSYFHSVFSILVSFYHLLQKQQMTSKKSSMSKTLSSYRSLCFSWCW